MSHKAKHRINSHKFTTSVWSIKTLIPDPPWSEHLNKITLAAADFRGSFGTVEYRMTKSAGNLNRNDK